MELIIKPTGKCNFACSFCSAKNLKEIKHFTSVTTELKTLLAELHPHTLIFTGGDPLLCPPSFYNELLNLGTWNLSFTTNLKDYFNNPEKWIDLFLNPRVSVGTSFQYGDGRRWDKDTIYNEQMFRTVFEKFKSDIGYSLRFISVIGNNNEKFALKHIELAKELGTKCKLNQVMPLGNSTEFYPLHKMAEIWLQIYEKGLSQWLDHDMALHKGGCGLNVRRLCKSTIRAVQFLEDGTYQLSQCEDDLSKIPIEVLSDAKCPVVSQEQIALNQCICSDCVCCELFNFCNGCKQQRELNKRVPEHCSEMKKKISRIKAAKWRLQ